MKAGTFITGLTLVVSANAQVRHHHRHEHKKRDAPAAPAYGDGNVVYETKVEYVTANAPHAIVYVDSNGKPISTSYPGQAQPAAETPAAYQPPAQPEQPKTTLSTSTTAPAYTPPKSSSTPAAPAYTHSTKSSAPAYTPPKSSSSAAPSSGSGSGGGRGITYSPYNSDNSCKSADQVKSDLQQITGYDYIRLYGSDCNQVANVLAACGDAKLLVGVFDPINNLQTESEQIIKQVDGDWSKIDTISIGNELVNGGKASVGQVTAAIGTARSTFKNAGFSGSIVTVDTFVAIIANPELCEASDFAAANCHAFFDGGKTAAQAGAFVKDQAQRVSDACGGKKTVITESGWPSEGSTNGAAVPSKENQQTAMASLKSSFSDNIYLYTAFNDLWKTDFDGSFGCEKYWGILSS